MARRNLIVLVGGMLLVAAAWSGSQYGERWAGAAEAGGDIEAKTELFRDRTIAVLRQRVNRLDQAVQSIGRLHSEGSKGGEDEKYYKAGYALAAARADLAAAEGNRDAVLKHRREASRLARQSVDATQRAYETDTITLDAYLLAIEQVTQADLALIAAEETDTAKQQ